MAAYYRDYLPVHGVIPVAELDQLPVTGWHQSTRPSELHIALLVIPGDPSTLFSTACMTGPQAATPQAGLPFPIIRVVPSMITQSVLGYNPQLFSKKVSFKFQHQARQVHQPAGSEREALTLQVNVPVAVEDLEEDSNTKNLSVQQQRAVWDHQTFFKYDQWVQQHVEKYQQYQYLFDEAMQQKNQPYTEVSADKFARQKAHDIATGQKGQAKVLSALGQVSQAMSQIYQESLL
ncbi:hypothetical protein BDW59DRAFT_168021 [Aspergillus cavernicola]|uniref:Uncharacterized protein n=1 Tax=Aspergillus cavernicola TaxID=176166 RepID=A0ABR4H7G8_9EURO